jgi:protein SCO1/2
VKRAAVILAAALACAPAFDRPAAAFNRGTPGTGGGAPGEAPAPKAADGRPEILRDVTFDQKLGSTIDLDLVFRDENGQPITLRQASRGKPMVLVPAYYECPMLCTIVLNGVVRMMRALPFDAGDTYTTVTYSFDPNEGADLAKKKQATYLENYRRPNGERGWRFLTGDAESIRALSEAIGFRYAWDDQNKQFAHASGIVVVTPEGRLSHYFYGVEFAPRDVRLALVEASREQIGTFVDQLLLFCFHYDPATGRYSKVAMSAVRAGGVLTLLAIGGFLFVMLRRERRAQPDREVRSS